MSQLEFAYKSDAHVQHFKRFKKALQLKDKVTFTVAAERAVMPSSNSEIPYSIKFSEPYNCECMSFIFGCARDPNFQCYHVIAAILRWRELFSRDVLPGGTTHPPHRRI